MYRENPNQMQELFTEIANLQCTIQDLETRNAELHRSLTLTTQERDKTRAKLTFRKRENWHIVLLLHIFALAGFSFASILQRMGH